MGVLSGNYWQDTLCTEQNPEPGVLVIFGASGDLARRKLFPALWALCRRGLLCAGARIIGCARHEYTSGSFRAELATALNVPAAEQEAFSGFYDGPGSVAPERLDEGLAQAETALRAARNALHAEGILIQWETETLDPSPESAP